MPFWTLLAALLLAPSLTLAEEAPKTLLAKADAENGKTRLSFRLEGDAEGRVKHFSVSVAGSKKASGAILMANQYIEDGIKSSHFRLENGVVKENLTSWDLTPVFLEKQKAGVFPPVFRRITSFMVQILSQGGESLGIPLSGTWGETPNFEGEDEDEETVVEETTQVLPAGAPVPEPAPSKN